MHVTLKAILAASVLASSMCSAQGYPNKPIRMIVGFPPGGGVDLNARLIAGKLGEPLGQQVLVDNRPGASGAIGAEITARAPADGHTIMVMSATTLTSTLLYKVSYDPIKDFTPITFLSVNPFLLAIHPSVPASRFNEFIAYARANPGKLNYASSGNGGIQHLAAELLQTMTDTQLVHVPYKGISNAHADIFAGRVQIAVLGVVAGMPYVKAGKVRALGVTSRTRMVMLPDMPTLNESGAPGFEVTQWNGLLSPAGLPGNIVDRLHRETVAALRQAEVIARMAADGSEPAGGSGAELASHMQAELDKWGAIIRKGNIKGD